MRYLIAFLMVAALVAWFDHASALSVLPVKTQTTLTVQPVKTQATLTVEPVIQTLSPQATWNPQQQADINYLQGNF